MPFGPSFLNDPLDHVTWAAMEVLQGRQADSGSAGGSRAAAPQQNPTSATQRYRISRRRLGRMLAKQDVVDSRRLALPSIPVLPFSRLCRRNISRYCKPPARYRSATTGLGTFMPQAENFIL